MSLLAPLLLTLAIPADTLGTIRPLASEQYFVAPQRESTVPWNVTPAAAAGPVEYAIRDYAGRTVAAGRAEVAGGRVEIRFTPERGFYEVEFRGSGQRFGVVALPPVDKTTPNPFFAIDSAMSWLVRGDERREGLVKVLRRSGVAMSRERLAWGAVEPARGRWNWETDRHYETLRAAYRRHDVPILEMFHDRAGWSGAVGKYPQDLMAVADSWREIRRRWQAGWGGLEVWNEPDISFGGLLPADQYVALVKTMAYAFDRRAFPLVGGVLARFHRGFLDNAAANGLLECLDALSFHTYDHAPRMERIVGEYRAWLAAHSREAMPLWITECGRPWKRGPDRPPAEEDAASALDIAAKGVESRACGIARYFPFVYPFYEENQSNFGMMDRQLTPLRAMAAYVQLVRTLSGGPQSAPLEYLGDLRPANPAVKRARVFGNAEETVAVVATDRVAAGAVVKIGLPAVRVEGIDGRMLAADKQGNVPIPDGLAYAWLRRADLGDRLQTETAAMRLAQLGRRPARPAGPMAPIVLRFQWSEDRLSATTAGYQIVPGRGEPLPIRVRAFNLAAAPQDVSLRLSVAGRSGSVMETQRTAAKIPARGFADVSWEIDLKKALAASYELRATVSAEGRGGGRILSLVVDLLAEPELAHLLAGRAIKIRLPIEQSERWQANIGAHGHMTIGPQPDGSCRLSATFGQGDRWVYPRFRLPEGLDLSKATGLVLRVRSAEPASVRVFLWEGEKGVGYITPESIAATDGRWHAVLIPFDKLEPCSAVTRDPNDRLDLDQVRRISIGLNTKAAAATLDFADVYMVR